MYKWQVHSAIGRGRPRAGEFARLADGIAASLRQFHVSVAMTAEDRGDDKQSRPSRAERSAAAAAEISSLRSAGIDARSLAATPPPSFTIRRVGDLRMRSKLPYTVGETSRGSGSRNPGGFSGRGGSRWVARGRRGGRGGSGGRGVRGGRARGARRRGVGRRGSDEQSADDIMPYTPEEQAYLDSIAMGVPTAAHVGITDLEALQRDVPGMATSTAPIGLVSTVRDHMRILAGKHGNEYLSSEQHAAHYYKGKGTLFMDEEDKARAVGPGRFLFPNGPPKYTPLPEAEREPILRTLVAGQYEPIKPLVNGDPLAAIDSYTQRNETYLKKDAVALRARVERMLPAAITKPYN